MVATRRRVTRGKSEKYEIGDKVEVVRVGGIDVGILLSKDEEDDSRSATHWVISVDGSSEEEVVSEKLLGRVLETQDQSDSSTFEKTVQQEPPAKKTTKAKVKAVTKKKKGNGRITRAGAANSSKSGEEMPADDGFDTERRPVPRPRKKVGDETVIEVKMLTGTLFIYRGENHRVEFVRTV